MTRLLFGLAVAAVVLTVYALVDAAFFDRNRIRGLPRAAWILIVLLLPVIGALLWLTVGRGRRGSVPRGPRTVAPDDDLEFLGQLGRDTAHELRMRQLEQELSELDANGGRPVNKAPDAADGSTGKATGAGSGSATPAPSDDSGDAPGVAGPRDA